MKKKVEEIKEDVKTENELPIAGTIETSSGKIDVIDFRPLFDGLNLKRRKKKVTPPEG